MLGKRLDQHATAVWLVNTGWTGGPYGEGHRWSSSTRAMVSAALDQARRRIVHPASHIPHRRPRQGARRAGPGARPARDVDDGDAYDAKARQLAELFRKNFEKFGDVPGEIAKAGPGRRLSGFIPRTPASVPRALLSVAAGGCLSRDRSGMPWAT